MEKQEKLSTPIFFDADAEAMNHFFNELAFSKLYVLTDENTHEYCLPQLMEFTSEFQNRMEILEIESGESNKSFTTAANLIEAMLDLGADKDAVVVNLGGGVISDLGGFIASVFKRKIRYVNIPTSLLAMVDAAVGGKTGVNLDFYKNQIGSFQHPEAVFVFTDFLQTLAEREIKSGFAEILKYCLIDDKAYFAAIEKSHFSEIQNWNDLIQLSITIKNEIVSDDPHESGKRKILNFGHTLGHAIESVSLKNDPNPVSHGEAVAAGMLMESYISVKELNFPIEDLKRIEAYILRNFGKISIKDSDIAEIFEFMMHDKKNQNNQFFPVLLKEIGVAEFQTAVSAEMIKLSIHYYINL